MEVEKEVKKRISGVYSRASSTYDEEEPRYFSYFGEKLVDFSNIQQNQRILDIACGRGASLFPALNKLGKEGYVTGIDITKEMVEKLTADLNKNDFENAKVLVMDAESLEYEDNTLDGVLCGFSIFIFPNLDKALQEVYRVLKPGGKFSVSTWNYKKNGIDEYKWLNDLVLKYIPKDKEKGEKKEINSDKTKNDFSSEDGMREIYIKAGFSDIETKTEEKTFYFQNKEQYYNKLWSQGFRGILEKIPENQLDSFKQEIYSNLEKFKSEKGISYVLRAIYTSGVKTK